MTDFERKPGCVCSTEPHSTNAVMRDIHERSLEEARRWWPGAYALYPPREGCPVHPTECGYTWYSPVTKRQMWFRKRQRPAGSEHYCTRRGPHEKHSCCCGADIDVHAESTTTEEST